MWIRVESFAGDSVTPSTVLHFWTDRLVDGAAFLSVGRKAGDIIFPTNKSVSRQHCEIKCLKTLQENRKNSAVEQQAMETNPFGCALVVENQGKAGTYVVEPTRDPDEEKAEVATTPENKDSDDDATDDEGVVSQPQRQTQSQHASQVVAPLGDGKLAVEEFQMSSVTKEFWSSRRDNKAAQLVKVDIDESRVLDFSTPRCIFLQVGTNAASTIKITWIPFRLVFSRLPKEQEDLRKSLAKIGASEESHISPDTTHLVSPKVGASAKPLTACCRGLPVVVPAYLEALLKHEGLPQDPLPSMSDFLAPFDKNVSLLQEKKRANPKLMKGYNVFFLDQLTDYEVLIESSGGRATTLYDLKNEKERTSKVEATIQESPNEVHLVIESKKRLYKNLLKLDNVHPLTLDGWAKCIVEQQPQLTTGDGDQKITIPTPSLVNSTPETQEPVVNESVPKDAGQDDESETDDEIPPSMMSQKATLRTQEDVIPPPTSDAQGKSKKRSPDKAAAPAPSRNKRPPPRSPSPQVESPVDSSLTELEVAPVRKRRKRGEVAKRIEESTILEEDEPQDTAKSTSGHEASNLDDPNDAPDFPVDQDDPPEEDNKVESAPKKTNPQAETSRLGAQLEPLGGADKNGWFVAAPKDDMKRKALRQLASQRYVAEVEDGAHFQPAATSKKVAAIVSPATATHSRSYAAPNFRRRNNSNGVDFRSFRKNSVPRKIDNDEIIVLVRAQAREDAIQQELEEEQRELEVQQRVADELFRDIGGAQPRRKRRS